MTWGKGVMDNRYPEGDMRPTDIPVRAIVPGIRPSIRPGRIFGKGRRAHMGMSVTISAATEQDAEHIFRLQYLCFQSEAQLYGNYRIDPLTQTLDELRAELATDCVLVARLGEEVIGTVRASSDAEGTAHIAKLCVHPRLQGHGLGARLLRAVEGELAARRGAKRFELTTGYRSEGNLRLYRRAGYERVGGQTGRDGIQQVRLGKAALADAYAASA